MREYGSLTRSVPINVYAVASEESMVDFGTYRQVLSGEVEFVTLERPGEFGLVNVEGAMLTGERHIVIDEARRHFSAALHGAVKYGAERGDVNSPDWDVTIDCTFCANDAENIDRFEPCVTGLLSGPVSTAVTIMDGPFPSVYPWNEAHSLSSLTSAKYTPLARCKTRAEAEAVLQSTGTTAARQRGEAMIDQMTRYWPAVRDLYRIEDYRLSIRAMPKSGADARLVDVVEVGERCLRVRAGKIDAILYAEQIIKEKLCLRSQGTRRLSLAS